MPDRTVAEPAKKDGEDRWASVGRFLRRVPRQERARSVVSAILEAAEEGLEIAERGPLLPLFARAGVAAGSFYEYFSSRDALLSAVVERITERNFGTFLEELETEAVTDQSFEQAVRRAAHLVVGHYLERPQQLMAVIRLADRLGLVPHIVRERDRFSDAVAARAERFCPEMSPESRVKMMRAAADALTGRRDRVLVSRSRPFRRGGGRARGRRGLGRDPRARRPRARADARAVLEHRDEHDPSMGDRCGRPAARADGHRAAGSWAARRRPRHPLLWRVPLGHPPGARRVGR
jgi:AcrR family transcriptional regulator